MERDRIIQHFDHITLFCLCVLVIFLPIAHTESIRAFSLGIPVGLWFLKSILSRRFLFTRTPVDLPILLFTLVAALSVITAVDPRYSLEEFIGEWVIGVFLFYMVVNNVRLEQIKYILGALLLGNILMVGYGIFDFFRDGGRILNFFRDGEQILNRAIRAASLHSGVGTFSTYLVTIIPYVFVAVFFLKKTAYRFAIVILLSLNLFALFLTYSPGAWLSILVLAFMGGWFFVPRKVFIPFLLFIGLIIFLGAPQKVFHYYDRLTASNTHPDFYNTRWILAKFSFEKIKETPLQMNGFGRRTFAKKFPSFLEKYKGAFMWHAHNTFLNVAIQMGVQGLLIFCFLLYRLLKYCLEREKSEGFPITRYYYLATFLMIITFFARNLSDDFFVDDSALLFWFLCGMIFALKNGIENRKSVEEFA
jgi:O-antigen ligase